MIRLLLIVSLAYSLLISAVALHQHVLYSGLMRHTAEMSAKMDSLRERMNRDDKLRGPERSWFDMLPGEQQAMGDTTLSIGE